MDKASIIKDAIQYIEELLDHEKRIKTEISAIESGRINNGSAVTNQLIYEDDNGISTNTKTSGKIAHSPTSFPIEILDLSVNYMGEKTVVVSLTCKRRGDAILKLCQVIELLKLKIITVNSSVVGNMLLNTLFVEAESVEEEELKVKIETAIAAIS